jgi:two-component system, sensor histidine kinase
MSQIFPNAVESYLQRLLHDRAHPLLLSFNTAWQLLEVQGDAAHFGLDIAATEASVRMLQDLFLGLPLNQLQDFPFVDMGNGRHAHVHLIPDGRLFHVLLIDSGEADRQRIRETPPTGNEAELAGYEKSKALSKLRQIRSELERQRSRLEEANALKNALIATLSHEFRTPLTSIFGYLHLLERRTADDIGAAQAVRAVRRSATYLFTLAENLLEYGRGEAGGALINPVEIDLQRLDGDLDAMFRPLAEEKGLEFRLEVIAEDPSPAVFDEIKLKQILINLLSNAVRYTARGFVAAKISWRSRRLVIEVSDSGIGIPPEFRASVFTAFNRGGHAGSKGAGLGLSIVKRLVEQMHGALELDSALGKGTRFEIVLPVLGQGSAQPAPLAASAPSPELFVQGQRALVVDDDPDVANLLDVLLTDLGFRVELLGDAMQAVAKAMADPPDLLLVDVELPGLSGNAAVYRLRSHGYKGRIVTLSAAATEEARDAALGAGSDFYLTKPLNVEQFVRVIQRAVQK